MSDRCPTHRPSVSIPALPDVDAPDAWGSGTDGAPTMTASTPERHREAPAAGARDTAAPPMGSAEAMPVQALDVPPEPDPAGDRDRTPPSGGRGGFLRSSAIMASGATVSRALGFVRNFMFGLVTAGGATIAGSAFSSANQLPDTIWILIGGGVLNAILVPAIVSATKRPDRGSDFVSRLMTLVVLAAVALTVVCVALVPILIIATNGILPQATYALAIQMAFFLMPQIIFSALYVMCGQLLNAHESFGPYVWATVMNNLVGILVAAVFLVIWGGAPNAADWTTPKLLMLCLMNVGGSAAQVVFLTYFVHKLRLHLRPKWGFRGLGLGTLSRVGLWTLGMVALGQLGVSASRWATGRASDLVEFYGKHHRQDLADHFPGLPTLQWGYLAFMLPQGIVAVALVTAAFPAISRHAVDGEHTAALARYTQTSRTLVVPMVLATAVFCALCVPVMWVIGGGSTPRAALANGPVLAAYMIGLVPFSANYLTKRVFYAYQDARAPFLMQIPVTAVSVIAFGPIYALVDPSWAAAVAAAVTSLGNLGAWMMGQQMLSHKRRQLGASADSAAGSAGIVARVLVAGVITFVVGFAVWWPLREVFFTSRIVAVVLGGLDGILMMIVFAVVAWLLKVEELRSAVALIRRRLPGRAG